MFEPVITARHPGDQHAVSLLVGQLMTGHLVVPPMIGVVSVLESRREDVAGCGDVGTHISIPTTMIGANEGGGVRITGTLPQRQLARTLRELREAAGLTLEEAAPKLDWSASKLGRIETAQQGVDVHGVRSMLDLYNIGGEQWTEILDLTREAKKKGWWHAYGLSNAGYVALEADAAVVYSYSLGYIPGLLQTAGYARAVFRDGMPHRTEADLDRAVGIRLLRQRRLTEDPPMELVAIVDETVLRRTVGGAEVMRDQLRHLVDQATPPSVCFQVVPLSAGVHQGMSGSFTVLAFAEPDEPATVYLENAVGATHVHKEAEVRAYKLVFDRLRSKALSPRDSVVLVKQLVDDL